MYVGLKSGQEWNLSMQMNNVMSGIYIYRRGVSVEGPKGGESVEDDKRKASRCVDYFNGS
jgi:hypothetical protein